MPIEETKTVRIAVNGDSRQVAEGSSVLELLAGLDLDPERVAIELNGGILKKALWAGRQLTGGEELEIVHFVGGG